MLALETETSWQLHLNDGDRPVNLQGEGFERLSASERAQFLDGVYANAAHGFQYLFNSFPISDVYERGEQLSLYLMRVHEFLNSPGFLDFAREVTGARTITYAAQATLYRPGHFLTHHDDLVKGKNRLVAYVSNFTPRWKTDWGGILQFIDRDGHVAEGYALVFNALNLFRVPQASASRLSVNAARCWPRDVRAWSALATTLRDQGRLADAEAAYRHALHALPDDGAAHHNLATTLIEMDRAEECEALAAARERPEQATIIESHVSILLSLGRVEMALPLILAQRERPPMDQRWIAYEARFDSPRRSTWW